MEFVTMRSKDGKVISARTDMVDYYQSTGWVIPGSQMDSNESEQPNPSLPTDPPPSIPEIRSWALKKGIPGVKPQGKLPRSVIEKYRAEH